MPANLINKYTKNARLEYVQRNIPASTCNYCCSGKTISTTYSEWVFVALVIQHAMRMCHTFICALSDSTFPHYLINGKIFEKKKVTEHKLCVLILYTTFV